MNLGIVARVRGLLGRRDSRTGMFGRWLADAASRVAVFGRAASKWLVAKRLGKRSSGSSRPNDRATQRARSSVIAPGLLLVGHPYAVLGRAEDIRTAACSCEAVSIPFAIRNLYGDFGQEWMAMHKDFGLMDRVDMHAAHRANLFVLNADEMERARLHPNDAIWEGRYNIGYWAWELSRFPDAWLPALDGLDEIWAPSRFIQQAIAEKAQCPVIWMPLAVEPGQHAVSNRQILGLPEDRFLFLFFFDFRSYVDRKNPHAVIAAFEQAFSSSRDHVGLVIKTNGMSECTDAYEALRSSGLLDDPRIHWIDRVMDDRQIKSLIDQCDCFVSLHRSEGFGRGLAEAMYMGKPVIASGYSGNLDFMNESNACLVDCRLIPVGADQYPFGAGQIWAEPDIEMAAGFMRALVDDPELARVKGAAGADYIRRHHSFAAVGARYRRRLQQLGVLDDVLNRAAMPDV